MRLHVEVMRRAKEVDAFAFAGAAIQLATARSIDSDHAGALADFKSIRSLVGGVARNQPYLYPLWCNAMAVELAAIGHTEEARAASAIAMASPLAAVYPEWQEPTAEIAERQSASAIVTVALPQAEADTPPPRPPLLNSTPHRIPATATTRAAFAHTGALV